MQGFFKISDDSGKLLLFFLQFFSVELFSLAGVESIDVSIHSTKLQGKNIRCLSVSEETLLLLEFLDLVFIGRLRNQLVDVTQGPFGRNLKSSVLLANTVATKMHIRVRSIRGTSSWSSIHHFTRLHPTLTRLRGHGYTAGSAEYVAPVGRHLTKVDSRNRTDGTTDSTTGECARRACIVVLCELIIYRCGRTRTRTSGHGPSGLLCIGSIGLRSI